jgi:thymidylate kinase
MYKSVGTQLTTNHVPPKENMPKERFAVLPLVRRLCRELETENILYCHWKSNNALDRSASGDNDLDLLVSRANEPRFTEILSRLGFKQAQAPAEKQMPGVLDYYGYDDEADKFVHIHLHYQLIGGHDTTKNYRLPIERSYLESAVQDDLFMVPAPEFEFIVFVIRMVLKHLTWDTILIKHGRLSASERRELVYLQTCADRNRTYEILQQHLPYMSAALFDDCLQALQPDSPLWTRVRIGQRVQSRLKAHVRRSRALDIWLKLWRRVTWGIQRRIFKGVSKRRLVSGGAIIAIVGGDGSGKSTAIDELYKWLSKDFEVLYTHLGKPKWSWTTKFVRGLLKIGRLLTSTPYVEDASILYKPEAEPSAWVTYNLAIRAVCVARDRYLAYAKARRLATDSGLVICDRFPLSQINLTDGPVIGQMLNGGPTNWFIGFLVKLEKKYYLPIVWPELIIVLKLDPKIAAKRKTDEDADYVRARSQKIWAFDWQQTPGYVVDAARVKEDVLSELKSVIWSAL